MARASSSAGWQRYSIADLGLLLALSSFWGLSFLFIELALRGTGPLTIVAGRTFVGGVVLMAIVLVRGRSMPRTWRVWRHLLVLGILNNAIPWALVPWAQQSLTSGLTALLMALVPTSTLLVSAVIRLEHFTATRLIGLLLALGGVGVIVGGDVDQPDELLAVAAVVVATILYASSAVYAKRIVSSDLPPLVLAAGQVCCAAAVTVPIMLVFEGTPPVAALDPSVTVSIMLMGSLGTGVAFLIFYTLIERVGATNATLTTYLVPVVAVVAGALVLDERLAPTAFAGGALIGGGSGSPNAVVNEQRSRPARSCIDDPT